MNDAAETYVRLVLAMGEHDADYVDAYYGPPQWREEVREEKPALDAILAGARNLSAMLEAADRPSDPIEKLRLDYLRRQTEALIARAEMLEGRRFTFDEESRALYDAVAPTHSEEYFRELNASIEREVPGSGALIDRVEAFRMQFVIPREKLDDVFRAAIDVCRERTLEHMALPAGESFTVEYVNDKSWSAYNWYKGGFTSLIQVNTDLPIFIDRAIDLACHEGYPGHHVYNALLEKSLVRDRGWVEFSVYALFSAQSLIAEGSANYGIDVAFPGEERAEMEARVLFPIAGLDPSRAERYYRLYELLGRTGYAGNEAARRHLDGQIDADTAAEWLTKYAFMAPARAQQRVKFIEQYRAYVINYNLGKDLVRDYIERRGGDRWQVFAELLSSPHSTQKLHDRAHDAIRAIPQHEVPASLHRDETRVRNLALHPRGERDGHDLVVRPPDHQHRRAHAAQLSVEQQLAPREHRAHRRAHDPRFLLRESQEVADDEVGQHRRAIGLQREAGALFFDRRCRERGLGEHGAKCESGGRDEHESLHARRIFRGELRADPSSHRDRDDVGALQTNRVHEAAHDVRLRGDRVVGVARLIGLAVAEEIGGVDAVRAGEDAQQRREILGAHGHAMHEQQRRTLAVDEVVDAVLADVHESAVDADGAEIELARDEEEGDGAEVEGEAADDQNGGGDEFRGCAVTR
ncbi:MAG TPA: hypothetical protein VNA69_00120 [Thermoanaerobaculia bacterium]|nr:hypothetical protein [Thermoanaerobaculia bacterium]